MKKSSLLIPAVYALMAMNASAADVTFLSQNFNGDPVNYTNTAFQGSGTTYWNLSTVGITPVTPLTGNATTYLTGCNMNSGGLPFNENAPPHIDFTVSAAAYTNLKLSVALAGSPLVETINYVRAMTDNDGDGTYETTIFNFTGGASNNPYNDKGTLNLGDLSLAFKTFSNISLPTPTAPDGNLRLRFELYNDSDSNNENAGIDDILISGTTVTSNTSAASGDWHTPATWNPASVPTSTSPVIVNNSYVVTITTAAAACNSLNITGLGSVSATGQSLTVANTAIEALSTTGGTLALDAASTLNLAKANTSASLAGLTVGSGTILNVTGELTVDASKNLSGATINTPKATLAGGSILTVGALNVPGAGYLTGSGTVAGTVAVATGGKVSPGTDTTISAIATNSLTLASGSILPINIASTSSLDQITVGTSDGLTINGGVISLYAGTSTTTFSTVGTYNLIGYTGTIGGNVSNLSVANKVAGAKYTFGTAGGYVTLTIEQGAAWNGGGTTANWNEAANWTGVSPSTGDILPFVTAGVGGAILNNNISGGSYASLQFESAAPAFTLNGNSVTLTSDLNGNIVLNNSSNTQTVNMPVTLGNNGALNAASASVVLGGTATIDNNGKILTIMGAQPVTLNGAMTGVGGVTMATGSKLNLGAEGAVSGTLTISGGTLDNTKGSAMTLTNPAQVWGGDFTFAGTNDLNMGTGGVTMNLDRTVTINNAKTLTVGGTITGTGRLTVGGNGKLLVTSTGNSIGNLYLNGGTTLSLEGAGASMTVTSAPSFYDNPNLLNVGNSGDTGPGTSATLTLPGLTMQDGRLVVQGYGKVVMNGELRPGTGDGRRSAVYVKNNATLDGTGRTLNMGPGWTRQDTYVKL